ncbi:hypothetical protein C8F04DRAFT_319813 [Mycena alexandri]|uniref:DUF6533 domain-containing protein n=1 Tax=Mycena alexandri TaxID=1745969 RepID=A0AAD6T499_9AGAR|nr:hypothetical protein C8F04DRAFT_319813 [Mycena alexandri]
MSVLGRTSYEVSAYMRVGSIAIASYDYLQTLPFEIRMWKEQWRTRHLTLSFLLFFLIRYTSILVLTVATAGFFARDFDRETCQRYFLIPSTLKVVQTMVSQAILASIKRLFYFFSQLSSLDRGSEHIIFLVNPQ